MNKVHIEKNGDSLNLTMVIHSPIWVKLVLGMLLLLSILGAISFCIRIPEMEVSMIAIGSMLCGIVVYFVGTLFIWNAYGKEYISISDKKVSYFHQYAWVKDEVKEFEYEHLLVSNADNVPLASEDELIDINQVSNQEKVRLKLSGKEEFESAIAIPYHELEKVIRAINKFLKNENDRSTTSGKS